MRDWKPKGCSLIKPEEWREQIHILDPKRMQGSGRAAMGRQRARWQPLVNGRICVVGAEANRCAARFGKGNERERHKWIMIKGARAPLARQSNRRLRRAMQR